MEPNENQDVETSDNNEEVLNEETDPKEEPKTEDKPKEKKKFTPEEQLAIHDREAKKLRKQLGLDTSEEKPSKEKASSELDLGGIAYLNSLVGLKGKDEIALAKEYIAAGKSVLDLADNKFFKQDLEALREAKASADAVPKTTKRSPTPAQDDLQTAIANYNTTGKLPEDRTMREKVLDAKLQKEKSGDIFSSAPVIS